MSDFSLELSPTIMNRFVDESGWSITGGLGDVRQRVRLGQPLGDDLAGLKTSVPGSKIMLDRRQAGHRLRADLVEAGHAVEQVGLQRDA